MDGDPTKATSQLSRTSSIPTVFFLPQTAINEAPVLNVKDYGAKGDGTTLDTPAINQAIEAAANKGGGTVWIPAGTYKSVSIHLKSNVALYLDQGATLKAAKGGYDEAEPNPSNKYQDYGHTHFQNSLLWGIKLKNVSIEGPGEIDGEGLVTSSDAKTPTEGNKAISLRECQNVTLKDFTIRHGGWFGILATGVDHLTIDNLKIDTDRDGMDIDCCRDVHVSNCTVNSPSDDGICLKSSYALGYARATEDLTITNCHVSGFKEGTVLDGTYVKQGGTGRIKFGTESNGGFKNIAISNCVFDDCCGLALETVDGADLEDVTISNIVMRDISNSPIFLRLGRRMRGPAGTPIGHLRHISISNITVDGARESSIIAGIPDHPIEDVKLTDIKIESHGGAPADQANTLPPEKETSYPEPESFGKMPSHGFFVRHVKGIQFHDLQLETKTPDARPPFTLSDVDGIDLFLIKSARTTAFATLENVKDLQTRMVDGTPDSKQASVATGKL